MRGSQILIFNIIGQELASTASVTTRRLLGQVTASRSAITLAIRSTEYTMDRLSFTVSGFDHPVWFSGSFFATLNRLFSGVTIASRPRLPMTWGRSRDIQAYIFWSQDDFPGKTPPYMQFNLTLVGGNIRFGCATPARPPLRIAGSLFPTYTDHPSSGRPISENCPCPVVFALTSYQRAG